MKILALLAHDKKKSLNHFLFEHMTKNLIAQGHSVQTVDLYAHYKEIPFYLQKNRADSTTNTCLEDYPFFHVCKKKFLEADALLLSFPVYCFSVPAILKCWIDMLTQIAYEPQKGSFPRPLHHIKKVFVVTTMGCPWFYKVLFMRNCIKKYLKTVFAYINVKQIYVHEITSVEKVTQANIQKYLDKIDKNMNVIFK